ncbi:exosortase E/protease, VPEID-CTERM system, partial [Rhodobacteraceae bacterium]|nr:exosortase E/protease, VPEID-CTERM system [Paracoccaceae bacterium]
MVALDYVKSRLTGARALMIAAVILIAELLIIGAVFKHGIEFHCWKNWPSWACDGASGIMIALYCTMGALAVTLMLRPEPFRALLKDASGAPSFIGLNIAGAALAFVPLVLLREGEGAAMVWPAWSIWAIALLMMIVGLALFIAPSERWRRFLTDSWRFVLPIILIGLSTPYLATIIRPAWRSIDFIADATFSAVAWATQLVGYEIDIYPAEKVIGANDFYINIAPVCSGIEGMALVTLFVTIYLSLFRSELRFPTAYLLYPIGIVLSAMFNIVRITVLLIIGLEGNPELAVGGFHSHA